MNTSIFRQVSLERLSSPEQLDQVLRVTSLKSWAGLGAVFLLLAMSVVWGFWGSIASTAEGQGVIIRSGGVLNIVSSGSGLVSSMKVRVGDRIKANETVAIISQPVLAERMKAMQKALVEAMEERQHAWQVRTDSANLQVDALKRQRGNSELQIDELMEQAKLASDQSVADEQLWMKGLITKQQALATKQRLTSIQDQIATLKAQLKQIDAQMFAIVSQPKEDDIVLRDRVSNLQREVSAGEKELSLAENVISPYGGEALELKVDQGSTVTLGEPIISIQPDVRNLELLAYFPSSQAKDMKTGMEVRVSPSTIKREEYGFMKGLVVYVADYPATPEALMHNFENESLVKSLSNVGPVTEIRVALVIDPSTPTGFQWSTSRGPNVVLSSGTMCSTQVVTRRQRPISLVFPFVKDKLGVM